MNTFFKNSLIPLKAAMPQKDKSYKFIIPREEHSLKTAGESSCRYNFNTNLILTKMKTYIMLLTDSGRLLLCSKVGVKKGLISEDKTTFFNRTYWALNDTETVILEKIVVYCEDTKDSIKDTFIHALAQQLVGKPIIE